MPLPLRWAHCCTIFRKVDFGNADDFVVLVSGTREHAEAMREQVTAVIAPMGLRLSPEKTTVVHIDDGFDFPGFRIQRHRKPGTKDPAALKPRQLDVLHELRRSRSVLYRCWQLKEGLRDLYRLADPADAPAHLEWWLRWACRIRIPAFITLAKTIRANRDRILAAIELGLSNSKLEGINSKIRLINHRGYGHHSAAALIAMIYLCCGGITVQLPTER